MQLPEQVILTREQHWPGLQVGTSTSAHWAPSRHPPLLKAHEYSQYASLVSSHTLHIVPGGHSRNKQATVNKTQIITIWVAHYILL